MDDMAKFYEGKIKSLMTSKRIKNFVAEKTSPNWKKSYDKSKEIEKLKKKSTV